MGEDPFGRDQEKPQEGGWLPPRPEAPSGDTFGERLRAGRAARAAQQAEHERHVEAERRQTEEHIRHGAAEWDTAHGPWHAGPYDPPTGTSGRATASMVLGIVGLLACPLLCSVLALVFGYQARREIADSHGRVGGGGMATAGIVLGWIGLAFGILAIIVFAMGWATFSDFSIDGGSGDEPFGSNPAVVLAGLLAPLV